MIKDLANAGNGAQKNTIAVLLHDIRSVHNVGSIFRTADALGVKKIYISGYSPTPLDRFDQPRNDFAKVSLGAEKTVVWEYFQDYKKALAMFKKEFTNPIVIAVEQDDNSVPYKNIKIQPEQSVLLVMGNEVGGVPKEILKLADIIAEIPQFGSKESLNVSVAFGIVGFGISNI